MAFNFAVERKNIILVPLRTFEFSHRLGHKETSQPSTHDIVGSAKTNGTVMRTTVTATIA